MVEYSTEQFHEDCISLTLPHLIDRIAERIPNRIFVSLPIGTDIAVGYHDYTYQDFARAVDKCAWWIDTAIGKSTSFETLAYIGCQDLRYVVLLLAAIKTGHKVLPLTVVEVSKG